MVYRDLERFNGIVSSMIPGVLIGITTIMSEVNQVFFMLFDSMHHAPCPDCCHPTWIEANCASRIVDIPVTMGKAADT